MRRLGFVLAACAAMMLCARVTRTEPVAPGVGFQKASAPDVDDRPLSLLIWYPGAAPMQVTLIGSASLMGLFEITAAINDPARGQGLPLIITSHGT